MVWGMSRCTHRSNFSRGGGNFALGLISCGETSRRNDSGGMSRGLFEGVIFHSAMSTRMCGGGGGEIVQSACPEPHIGYYKFRRATGMIYAIMVNTQAHRQISTSYIQHTQCQLSS